MQDIAAPPGQFIALQAINAECSVLILHNLIGSIYYLNPYLIDL